MFLLINTFFVAINLTLFNKLLNYLSYILNFTLLE